MKPRQKKVPLFTVFAVLILGVDLAPTALWAASSGAPQAAVDSLLGPSARTGLRPEWRRYDAAQTHLGRLYADTFPAFPKDLVGSNFYDLALALYHIHYRTGDPYWKDKARTVARAWRDDPLNQNIGPSLTGVPGREVPAPHAYSTLGLAIYALEAADADARRIVNDQARLGVKYCGVFDARNCDMREGAYSLMAMLTATALGDDHRDDARRMLESFLAGQKADGRWENVDLCALNGCPDPLVPATYYTLNYMAGLVMEALILYDRVLGDPRILPALAHCLQWTWTTQWVAPAHAFKYANLTSGSVNTNPYPNLNGLLLPAWGYVYAKTRDHTYLTQGDQILKGLVEVGTKQVWQLKQFTQLFRSSSQYLGYVAIAGASLSTPPPMLGYATVRQELRVLPPPPRAASLSAKTGLSALVWPTNPATQRSYHGDTLPGRRSMDDLDTRRQRKDWH
jgi:hypothetical protein